MMMLMHHNTLKEMMNMARPICRLTGKERYLDSVEGQLALANIELNASHYRKQKYRELPTRTYRCGACGSWHLTSKSRARGELLEHK
jgi:hypothetical protein